MTVRIKFWGVRGSIACPTPHHVVYGGNTSCVEISGNDGINIILDAGTGLRALGQDYLLRQKNGQDHKSAVLLLTHTHWDHINGFPFFVPAYQPGWRFRVLAGHLSGRGGIHHVLASQMAYPMFPVPLEALKADLTFEDFHAGEELNDLFPGVSVRTCVLNHPNGATGYRLTIEGRSICYVTDTEHVPGNPDPAVLDLISEADLVIYDSTYTDEEFPAKAGWGHSTWQEGVRLCRQAKARQLVVFHHDPDHDDSFMERLEDEARQVWSGVLVARDNMVVSL